MKYKDSTMFNEQKTLKGSFQEFLTTLNEGSMDPIRAYSKGECMKDLADEAKQARRWAVMAKEQGENIYAAASEERSNALEDAKELVSKIDTLHKEDEKMNNKANLSLKEADADYIKIGNKVYPGSAQTADLDKADLQRQYDAEQEEKAEIAKKAELAKQAKGLRAQIPINSEASPDDRIEAYFDVLVPSRGKCDNLAGELIRAISKIGYRWSNDGDYFMMGYGLKTAAPATAFIYNHLEYEEVAKLIEGIIEEAQSLECPEGTFIEDFDKKYSEFIDELSKLIADILDAHDEYLAIETTDMLDEHTNDIKDNQPYFHYYIEVDERVDEYIRAGKIIQEDVINEVESCLLDEGCSRNIEVEDDWGNIVVTDLSYDDYFKCKDIFEDSGKHNYWDNYVENLKEEYGDPAAEEDENYEDEEEYLSNDDEYSFDKSTELSRLHRREAKMREKFTESKVKDILEFVKEYTGGGLINDLQKEFHLTPEEAADWAEGCKCFSEKKTNILGKDMDVTIDFPIVVNTTGRVKVNDAKKLLKYLLDKQMLKASTQYFVKDSTGEVTAWDFHKSIDPYFAYEFSFECTDYDPETETDRDFYNCLYIPKTAGKLDLKNAEWEAHKVESKKVSTWRRTLKEGLEAYLH